MKVSVIMSACNQGNWLRHTIDSAIKGLQGAKDWEIIVIDDHSTDDCVKVAMDKFGDESRIQFHRPEEKMGVSHARHWAGEMATGQVILTTDTHCTFTSRSIHRMAHWANRLRAIIMPVTDFQNDNGSYSRVEGGSMSVSARGLRIDRPRKARKFPALFGGTYLMRKDVWDALGGWVRLPGYWAGEEQIMTMLAYRFGVPIALVSKHVVKHHRYRQHGVYPYELPKHHPGEIAHYIHATCLPSSYDKIWNPLLTAYYGREMEADPTPLREWIDSKAVWDENRVIETLTDIKTLKAHQPIIKRLERFSNAPSV